MGMSFPRRRNIMKKLLSALLVLVMLLSLPGIGALAASDELT